MEIRILSVGKIKEKYLNAGIAEYAKRLSRYCKLTFCQVADEKTPDRASDALNEQIKDTEGQRLLKHIREQDYVIALAIDGNMLDSVELSRKIGRGREKFHCFCDRRVSGTERRSASKSGLPSQFFQNDISPSADADDPPGTDLQGIPDIKQRTVS